MKTFPLFAAPLLLTLGLLGVAAPAEAACAATPTVAQTSTRVCVDPANQGCPVFVWQRQGWLSYGYCVPPEPAAASSHPCVGTPELAQQRVTACVRANDLECPVFVWRETGWLSYGMCLPPTLA